MRNMIALPLLAFAAAACGHTDTGQIDYRVAEPPATLDAAALRARHEGARCTPEGGCEPLNPAPLIRRYQPGAAAFAAPPIPAEPAQREVFSIELEQGMIGGNLLEGVILGRQFGRTAEIAILANVFEFSESATGAARFVEPGQYRQTSDLPEGSELKLIYYSNDVHRDQPLNFSNLPLLTRRAFSGRSVAIQIVVVEIDARSGPMSSLLQTLARFGQSAAPPIPGVQDVLSDLGEALFAGTSQDDVLFDYRFVLSAPGVDPAAVQATLAPGRYVLRRSQDRATPIDWRNVVLDHNTGRLFAGGAEIRRDLYLTLNVRKYPPGTPAEHYAFQDWNAFRDAIAGASDPNAAAIDSVTANLKVMLEARRSTEWRSRLSIVWAAAEARLLRLSELSLPADYQAPDAQCALLPTSQRERAFALAREDARGALRTFLAEYTRALRTPPAPSAQPGAAAPPPPEPEFKPGDRDALVAGVTRHFLPLRDPEVAPHFASASSFEAAYVTAAGQPFIDFALAAAAANPGPVAGGCDELIRRGLAIPAR